MIRLHVPNPLTTTYHAARSSSARFPFHLSRVRRTNIYTSSCGEVGIPRVSRDMQEDLIRMRRSFPGGSLVEGSHQGPSASETRTHTWLLRKHNDGVGFFFFFFFLPATKCGESSGCSAKVNTTPYSGSPKGTDYRKCL